jgi:hypothetical protein
MFRSITGLIAKVAGLGPAAGTLSAGSLEEWRHGLRLARTGRWPAGPASRRTGATPWGGLPDGRAEGGNVIALKGRTLRLRGAESMDAPVPSSDGHPPRHGLVLSPRSRRSGWGGLPAGVAARMPCGADVRLSENVQRDAAGQPRARQVICSFDDPASRVRDGEGTFDFDAVLTPGGIDLQNVFNNSHCKGALDLAVWHMTRRAGPGVEFRISGVDDEALCRACEAHYGMTRSGGRGPLSGNAADVARLARARLVDKGWTLRDGMNSS